MHIVDLVLIFFCAIVLYYLFNGAIFVPTRPETVAEMVRLANRPGIKVADLGSGDGRIVIAFAKAGAQAVGYEVNPILALWSWYNIWKAGATGQATIHFKSFWAVDLSGFDAIVVFGMTHIMGRLQAKLERELRPGTLVVSNIFKFPNWPIAAEQNGLRLYRR